MPTPIQGNRPHHGRSRWPANGNSAPPPSSSGRQVTDTVQAAITGSRLRGFHSNNRSSTASSTAAIGVPKIAVMPAAAPATSRVLRSAALRLKHCANSEPMAPPVMMIGPSAPNGPPVPIEIADDSGLSTATLGCMRLPPIRIASMASGMPWPRIFSEPKRAISPMMRPPIAGARTIHRLGLRWASDMVCVLRVCNHTRLVTRAIARNSSHAAAAPPVPTTIAIAMSMRTRRSVVKSPRRGRRCPVLAWAGAVRCIMVPGFGVAWRLANSTVRLAQRDLYRTAI